MIEQLLELNCRHAPLAQLQVGQPPNVGRIKRVKARRVRQIVLQRATQDFDGCRGVVLTEFHSGYNSAVARSTAAIHSQRDSGVYRDLPAAIAAGKFREDLFYRLNVFPIEIPPLQKREEDIPLLVQYFIDRYAREAGKNIRNISKETLDLFQSYPWPGNIRELRNVIERSVIVCETESFSVDESWLSRQPNRTSQTSQLELRQRLIEQEREVIEAALTEAGGRVFGPSGAAAKLGIARSTLDSKIKTLKIDKNRFKISKSIPGF